MIQKIVLVIVVLFLLRGLVAPRVRPGDRPPMPVPQPKKTESTKPASQQLLELGETLVQELAKARKRIGEGIAEGIGKALAEELPREGGKYLSSVLKTNDPVDTELLTEWMAWFMRGGSLPHAEPGELEHISHSIFLIRPGKAGAEIETIMLSAGDKPFLRYTRAQADLEKPMAIFTGTCVVKGKLFESQRVLMYGPNGKWVSLKANERKQELPDQRR